MHALVPVIIIAIICIQIFFFIKNLLRMKQFSRIFAEDSTWAVVQNEQTGFVVGIFGLGNTIFESIRNSINKYLGNNSGSVIDFSLLKDAVDRHCDSVENDIATQTPIPLYWGLAGTMAGVIIGLTDLLNSDAILTLMGSSGGVINVASENAAKGVNALLSGIAWAMLASIVGILLTTANSILFKRCKLKEENGKNSFLAWMQSKLLPELPSDTSQALNGLVNNLNRFNDTFKDNTWDLDRILKKINESYAVQAEVVRYLHDMDVMKMAKANVRVLQELKECTDNLEVFNMYLNDIEGYTTAIHRFEAQFAEQSDRLHILEEIRDFFREHRSSIATTVADADMALQNSLESIKESTSENVSEMQKLFVEQSEHFKKILKDEAEAFERFMTEMNARFGAQMQHMPQLAKQLEQISAIPDSMDKLIDKMEKSIVRLASQISSALHQSMPTNGSVPLANHDGGSKDTTVAQQKSMPSWMRWTAISALVIIAGACVFNVVVYFFPKESQIQAPPANIETVQSIDLSKPVASHEVADKSDDKASQSNTSKSQQSSSHR